MYFFFFKQKTAYEMRISYWSSDVCSSDLSAITRIVFGPDGAVLDVGRAQRTVTGQMRRAVIARDQHCVYPGCDQPPSRCEVHHAVRRTDERRVGKDSVRTCCSRGTPYNLKHKS